MTEPNWISLPNCQEFLARYSDQFGHKAKRQCLHCGKQMSRSDSDQQKPLQNPKEQFLQVNPKIES